MKAKPPAEKKPEKIRTLVEVEELGASDVVDDPVEYVHKVLHDETWPTQELLLRALLKHDRIAVKACHASSKTFSAAELTLWWLARYDDGIVVTTAPTFDQVRLLIWREIQSAVDRAGGIYPRPNQTELKIGPNNYAVGRASDKQGQGVRFHGFHAANLLIIVDEAPGLPVEVWQAIEGARAGGHVVMVILGNPTMAGGPFYDAFTSNRDGWYTLTIDAYDTPNFDKLREMAAGDKQVITSLLSALPYDSPAIQHASHPYLVTPKWAKERLGEWGEASPLWQSKVRGDFPDQAEDALISLAWLEAAKLRKIGDADNPHPAEELEAGVDVAGPGDDECVAWVRRGAQIVGMFATAEPDPRGPVIAFLNPYKANLRSVQVDSIGIGYNFGLHLRDQGFPVNNVNVGETAPYNPERFANMKAELYWGLRETFRNGEVAGLTDDTTISQLATIRYEYTPQGKVKIESKIDARKRGVKSPDRAEALMLAFAHIRPGILDYARKEAERQDQIDQDERHGRYNSEPTPENPKGNRLLEIYNRTLKKIEDARRE